MRAQRVMVLGDTGMAGAAVLQAARARGASALGASRHGETTLDVRDAAALFAALEAFRPTLIVNAAAKVAVAECEHDPGEAWRVNARPAAVIASYARRFGARVAHISTDHFYSGDGAARHAEDDPVVLLNEYARGKYAAEALALTHRDTLVLRTNIIGLRSSGGVSFGEWALQVIEGDQPATLFTDQYVSTLDVWSFAEALLDLAATTACGVLNVASSDVFSKAALIQSLAAAMGRTLTRAQPGSVSGLEVMRADSLGLDVSRAQAILGRSAPDLTDVAEAFAARAAAQAREPSRALGS